MGIQIGTQTVTLEKRLGSFRVNKDLENNKAELEVEWVLGYWDEEGNWHTTKKGVKRLSPSELLYILGLKESQLGFSATEDNAVGELFNKALYALITDQIPLKTLLTVNPVDSSGNLIEEAIIEIYDEEGKLVDIIEPGQETELPILSDATLIIDAFDYKLHKEKLGMLAGTIEKTVVLVPEDSTSSQ